MSEALQERLKKNSSAFDGLLSLIPSKYYYDEDTQDQWKQKKKTKEQAKQSKKMKLDPAAQEDNAKSAGEVSQKRAQTAKPVRIPGKKTNKAQQEQQNDNESEDAEKEDAEEGDEGEENEDDEDEDMDAAEEAKAEQGKIDEDDQFIRASDEIQIVYDDEGNEVEMKDTKPEKKKHKELSPEEKQKKQENLSKLKARLQEKIELMKTKRKAPGSKAPGAPKSREQILEERKKKQERKRKRSEDDEDEEEEEEENEDAGNDSEDDNDNDNEATADKTQDGVMFQNMVFKDGDRITSDLTKIRKLKKKKGPANRDIKAHLKKVEQHKEKLEKLSGEEKQKKLEQEKWNRMILQAEGVKVKDDEKLLKKALKNKERQKRKSEMQWDERERIVKKSISDRLKRREENLQIRKENKGVKRKMQKKQLRKFKGAQAKKGKKKAGF